MGLVHVKGQLLPYERIILLIGLSYPHHGQTSPIASSEHSSHSPPSGLDKDEQDLFMSRRLPFRLGGCARRNLRQSGIREEKHSEREVREGS